MAMIQDGIKNVLKNKKAKTEKVFNVEKSTEESNSDFDMEDLTEFDVEESENES